MLSRVTPIFLVSLLCVVLMTEAAVVNRKRKVGCSCEVNVTDPEVQAVAAKATAHIEKARNSSLTYRLQEVVSVKLQIDSRKKFQMTLRIGQTNCFRLAKIYRKHCSIVEAERCAVTVWVWKKTTKVTNFTCEMDTIAGNGNGTGTTKRPKLMPGGEMDIKVNRDDVIEAVMFATAELTYRSNDSYSVQPKRITKATSQVVAGAMYRLTLEVSVTASGENTTKTATCAVTVWDQTWRIPRHILQKHECNRLIS